nr:unnamed protein product [Callosobruchus chinensis]
MDGLIFSFSYAAKQHVNHQKINRFARFNAKLEDYKDDIKSKEKDLQSIEEVCEEIELFDDDEKIPYLVEAFIYQNVEKAQSCLADAKKI